MMVSMSSQPLAESVASLAKAPDCVAVAPELTPVRVTPLAKIPLVT